MKNMSLEKSRKITFFTPMVLYIIFIWVFVISRFFFINLLFGNGLIHLQYFPRRYNLVPFATIQRFDFVLILINLFLFTPAGLYIHALAKKKNVLKSIFICFLLIVGVEASQYILSTGTFDVDDIILNTVGMVAGVFISHIVYLLFKKDRGLSNASLSATSMPVIPMLFAIIIETFFWFEYSVFVPICIVAFLLVFLFFYQFFRKETRVIKILYASSCILFSLLFFFCFLPMAGPPL